MCVEGLVSGILFHALAVVQHDVKAACLAVLGVCGIISVTGMLVRPFISNITAEPKSTNTTAEPISQNTTDSGMV